MSRCLLTEPLYCELMVLSILLLVNIRRALTVNKICFVNCWSGGTTSVLVVFFVSSGKFSTVRVVFSGGLMVLGVQL
jgi:hypothetical protein